MDIARRGGPRAREGCLLALALFLHTLEKKKERARNTDAEL